MTTLAQEASHPSAKDGWVAACEELDGPQRQRRLARRDDPWVRLFLAPGSRPSILYDLEQSHVFKL